MKLLLVTPPLTQLNTPYPATTVLKGYLQSQGVNVCQKDLGIELVNSIYSKDFLDVIFSMTDLSHVDKSIRQIYDNRNKYIDNVEVVMQFLQGKDLTVATRIANRTMLPEGPRFNNLEDMDWAFGVAGLEDRARYLSTLFIEDIADYIRETISPYFDLIKYAEQLSSYAFVFNELDESLRVVPNVIDKMMLHLLDDYLSQEHPDIVGFSVPFPGCMYSSLRCAKYIKENYPKIVICLGGGYPNTELRNISDVRIFNYVDYIILDDGELPLLRLTQMLDGSLSKDNLVRTYYNNEGEIIYSGNDTENVAFDLIGIPDFDGLPIDKYISMTEMGNPMHRLWSNGKWNKLMMAHGCYWAKCAFCDTSLDYIKRYDSTSAIAVVDKIESIMHQTGQSGFHFVDEAMPPKLLKEVAEEILHRKIAVSFWGNIRFEKTYTSQLCDLLASAGFIAVSGGLEVASDRLLKLINKGVTVEQTVNAARNLTNAGIMVHTYLMYGFPTETLQETINAMETVRRMFEEGIVQSAFWHRYAMTIHSPSGKNPEKFGVHRISSELNAFSNNEVDFIDDFDYDVDAVGDGLRFATYNYMNGVGLDLPLKKWFNIKVPLPKKM